MLKLLRSERHARSLSPCDRAQAVEYEVFFFLLGFVSSSPKRMQLASRDAVMHRGLKVVTL